MRPKTTLALAFLLASAAVAAPASALHRDRHANAHGPAGPDGYGAGDAYAALAPWKPLLEQGCELTATWSVEERVLDNGTLQRARGLDAEADCPGREDDREVERADARWIPTGASVEAACVVEREGRIHEERLDNGTLLREVRVEYDRDCPGRDADVERVTERTLWLEDEDAPPEKGRPAWVSSMLGRLREDAVEAAHEGEARRHHGLQEALQHVPSHVAAKFRAMLAGVLGIVR